jgi:hypothetical protein
MPLNLDLIKQQIQDMRNEVLNGVYDNLETKYSYMFEKVPSLFKLIKENETEYSSMLEYIMSSAEAVNNSNDKKSTMEEKTKEIDEVLAETYIYPVVGKLDEQSSSSKK